MNKVVVYVPAIPRFTDAMPEEKHGHLQERMDVDGILNAVGFVCCVTQEALHTKGRRKHIAWARHIAMYLLRADLLMSFPQIGKIFGCDHTTVMYACLKIQLAIEQDKEFSSVVDSIRKIYKPVRECRA